MTQTQRGRHRQAGFSLVELLVVLAIFVIVTGAVFGLLNMAQIRYAAEKRFLESFQGARIGVDLMVRDIHNAGYPPPYTYAGNLPYQAAPPGSIGMAPGNGPTPLNYDMPVPWDSPTQADIGLQDRFATGIVGVRNNLVDLTCTVNGGATPCDVPDAFDLILEMDVDPEASNPLLGPTIEWVRYRLCWMQPDGTCRPNVVPPNPRTTVITRGVATKNAALDPTAAVISNLPFVENIVQRSDLNVGDAMPDGTANTAIFSYICAGGQPSCTVEQIQNVVIMVRVRSAEADIQTRQQREITLRGLARRLNPSR